MVARSEKTESEVLGTTTCDSQGRKIQMRKERRVHVTLAYISMHLAGPHLKIRQHPDALSVSAPSSIIFAELSMAKRGFPWAYLSASILFTAFIFFASQPILHHLSLPLDFGAEPHLLYVAQKKNIWSDLDGREFEDVLEFLYTVPNDLNLTRVRNATA
jgi:hypothetical protein